MKLQKVLNLFNVAIYIRLSREDGDKEESDSVGNQRKLLTEYVAKKEDFILYDIYVDDGYSGTNFNRPSFQRMIADIEDGKVNCVVVKDLSRFGRDYIDTGRYLERYFPELGVRFISVTDSIDSMKQAYDMLLPIKNIFNEQYANMVQGTKHQRMRSKQKKMPKEDWIIVENTHEPIIDKETWEKAQSLLKKRTRELDLETNKNIFAGFVKCGDCGRAMTKNMWRRADGSKTYSLYCGTYKRNGKQYCTPHTLPMAVLEDIVLGDLKAIVDSVDNLKELVQSQSFTASKVKRIADTELGKIKAELERVKRLKKSIYEDYREELISKEEFLSYREDYLKKEELYSKQIEALEEKKKDNVTEDVFETPWLKRLLELKDIESLDRDIVVEMISEIRVYENRKIKITYNFGNELEHLFSSVYSVESEEKVI